MPLMLVFSINQDFTISHALEECNPFTIAIMLIFLYVWVKTIPHIAFHSHIRILVQNVYKKWNN
jgi:hypothetical protein